MSVRVALARTAMRAALQLRRSLAIAREEPVNVYDLASMIGMEIRFMDAPSLEGMFLRDPHPAVVLPSLNHRPRGRVTFTCAHEVGHFQLGHGTTVDEYLEGGAAGRPKSDDEFAADTFASSLLMPRQAVLHRFTLRGVAPSAAEPLALFAIAGELDVGYQTLLKHIRYGLEVTTDDWLQHRQRTSPKQLRDAILGAHGEARRLVIVDRFWPRLPVDLEVGDCIAIPMAFALRLPLHLTELSCSAAWRICRASRPGLASLSVNGNSISVRVARSGYVGIFKYRFLDDPEAE